MTYTQLQEYAQSQNFNLEHSYTWITPDGFRKPNGYEIGCTIGKHNYVTWHPLTASIKYLKAEIDFTAAALSANNLKPKAQL